MTEIPLPNEAKNVIAIVDFLLKVIKSTKIDYLESSKQMLSRLAQLINIQCGILQLRTSG